MTISVDWGKEGIFEEWEFVGAQLMQENAEIRKSKGDEDADSESAYSDNMPMMNFAYPLYREKLDSEEILEVCEKTSCTVVRNIEEEKYYLALSGGGMDLSQSIAYAYILIDGFIDWDMLLDIELQPCLSINEKAYRLTMKELKRQCKIRASQYRQRVKDINARMKELRAMSKERKSKL